MQHCKLKLQDQDPLGIDLRPVEKELAPDRRPDRAVIKGKVPQGKDRRAAYDSVGITHETRGATNGTR